MSTLDGAGKTYISSGLYYIASTIDGLAQPFAGYVSTSWLQSTVNGLGGIGYISTASVISTIAGYPNYLRPSTMASTVDGLGQLYISASYLFSTVAGLSSIYITSNQNASTVSNFTVLEQLAMISTVKNLASSNSMNYISTQTLQSTVVGLGQYYISSAQLQLSVGNYTQSIRIPLMQRMVANLAGTNTAGATYLSTDHFTSTVYGITSNVAAYLPQYVDSFGYVSSFTSTVGGLGLSYISSLSLQSTVAGVTSNDVVSMISTVDGLGSIGYISVDHIVSTVIQLSNIYDTQFPYSNMIYLSTPALTSTVDGLGTLGYISASELTSTYTSLSVINSIPSFENNFGYIVTQGLVSTVVGLGQIYISYSGLFSTLTNIGSNYIFLSTTATYPASSNSLASTIAGSIASSSNVNSNLQVSTLAGLGTSGYISSVSQTATALTTTVNSIKTNGYTRVAKAYPNGYVYYDGTNITASSKFYEELDTSICLVPIVSANSNTAVTIRTIGYGSNFIYGDGTYLTISSDRSLKENIQPLSSALARVTSLRGVEYKRIGESNDYIGCIAQEVEPVFPEVVTTHPDPLQLKAMKYEFLSAPLVESLKELIALHSTLKDAVAKRSV